jgi:hypothetical protein
VSVQKGYSVIKRISLLLGTAFLAAMMMVATAAPAFAAAKECDSGDSPGCKTQTTTTTVDVDDPNKNNDRFFTTDTVTTEESQRGNFNDGTTSTNDKVEKNRQQTDCQNPSTKQNGPSCA